MIQFELIPDNKYTVQGSPQFSEDGQICIQNINANFRVVGNTYEALNYSMTVFPIPSFSTLISVQTAAQLLTQAAQTWLETNYPNIE